MIRIVFVLSIAMAVEAAAGPRVIGNGGNVKEENPVTVSYVQSLLPDSKLFILSWLNGLEGQIKPDDGLRGRNPRDLPIPAGAEKLFRTELQQTDIYDKLSELKILFNTSSPCDSAEKKTDASVISEKPPVICVSGWSMAGKLNEGNAKIQLEALILHEVTHLMGATEEEAIAIQAQYLSDMRFVAKESILQQIGRTNEILFAVKSFSIPQMILKSHDEAKLCEMIYQVRSQLGQAFRSSEITPVAIFSAFERDKGNALNVFAGQVLHLYLCGRSPERPTPSWSDQYEKGFRGKIQVTLEQWQKNRGVTGIRKTTYQMPLRRIRSRDDLVEQFLTISLIADELEKRLEWNVLRSFEIQLNER